MLVYKKKRLRLSLTQMQRREGSLPVQVQNQVLQSVIIGFGQLLDQVLQLVDNSADLFRCCMISGKLLKFR